jgi:hypothetical protein
LLTNFPNGITSKGFVIPVDFQSSTGNVYYAIQTTESYYADFVNTHKVTYSDGTVNIYNTIQGALDVCVAERGDTVVIIGGWTLTTGLSVDRIYGLRVIGVNPFGTSRGGQAEITYNGMGTCFTISNPKMWLSDITFYYGGATHSSATSICLDLSGRVFSHGVIKNINIRKTAGTDAQGVAIVTGSPSSSVFENIQINSPAGNTNRWQTGLLQTGDDLCHYKNIEVGGTEGYAIYNPGSTRSLYEHIIAMPSCNDGLWLTGITSAIIDSRNMAGAAGTSTVIKSQCFLTGTNEMT